MNLFIGILAVLSSLFIWLYIQRSMLPYNSEGRFFDSETGVVYHQQTNSLIGLIAIVMVLLTVILVVIRKKQEN